MAVLVERLGRSGASGLNRESREPSDVKLAGSWSCVGASGES